MLREVEPILETEANITALGRHLRSEYEQAGMGLPLLVVVPRSGYTIGEIISRQWQVSGRDMLQASVGERIGDPKPTGQPSDFEIGQFPTAEEVEGQNLLVIDAVAKTGETLAFIAERLRDMGASCVNTAVLYEKAGREPGARVDFPPNFSFRRKDPFKFIILGWELDEYLPMPENPQKLT